MKKKWLPALLALVMVLGMLPLTVFAEDNTVTDEGEGKAEWLNTGTYYKVSEYLTDADKVESAITSEGTVENVRAVQEAVLNLQHAVEANKNSTGDKKTELEASIAATQAKFAAVTKMDLSSKELTDVGFLVPFIGLTELNLSGNSNLEDLGGLAGCTALTTLNLTGTGVTSLAPLADCTSLNTLTAPGLTLTEIGDVEQLGSIANLTLTGTKWKLDENISDEDLALAMAAINYLNAVKPSSGISMVDHDGQVITPDYTITIADGHENNANGTVSVTVEGNEVTKADEGATVTITATPEEGYSVESVNVSKSGVKVDVTPGENNTYTFTMPATDVNVDVRFKSNTNANLQVNDSGNAVMGLKGITVSGMLSDHFYVIRLAASEQRAENSVLLTVTGETSFAFNCKPGQFITVFEFASEGDLAGTPVPGMPEGTVEVTPTTVVNHTSAS